jgi:hypothetical protein
MRGRVSRAEVAALRKRAPVMDLNPIALIVRTIVSPSGTRPEPAPRPAMQDALIAAAHAAYAVSGNVQRLILDNRDPAGGRLLGPHHYPERARG